jgi:ABC-type branched-subunit amino acid transport system substrate-binding protein
VKFAHATAGLLIGLATAASAGAADTTADNLLRRGELLFRSGSSAQKNPVIAVVAGGTRLPGTAASCAGCHGRDGSGRSEGGVSAPDIRWPALTQSGTRDLAAGRSAKPYDEAALVRAITRGLDSSGNPLAAAMPRFELYDEDLEALTSYLKQLHLQRDPGISDRQVVIGTVLPLTGAAEKQGLALRALLQNGIDAINAKGGLHGRTLTLDVEDAEGGDAEQRMTALGERVLAIVAPYAPRLQTELRAAARQQVPVVAPVTGPEAQGLDPLFSTLPSARHVMGALAGYWSRLPEQERGELTIVLGETGAESTEDFLRNLLPKAGRYRFVNAKALSAPSPGQTRWLLLDPTPGLLRQLQDKLRGARMLVASTSIAGAPGTVLAEAESIIVAAPLLPPREDPAFEQMQNRLRQLQLEPPPALVTIQALRGIAVLEESLRRSGRDLSREKLVQGMENISRIDTPGGPLSFGPRQRAGARGATLFSMDPSTGRLTLVAPWANSL